MRREILEALKAKFPGVSDSVLGRMAEYGVFLLRESGKIRKFAENFHNP